MYIVSSRKGFWSDHVVTTNVSDEVRDVQLETGSSKKKTVKELENHISGKKVLLLLHGYNNESGDVRRAYGLIAENEKKYVGHYDVVLGYTWPGGDDRLDYFAAKNRASAVAGRFEKLLRRLLSKTAEVGVMSHSMGCRISLIACENLHRSGAPKNIHLRQYLMAAAVDNESIETDERYFNATVFDDITYVFHSKNDSVLGKAYRAAEWDRALGYSGPENVSDIEASTKVANCKRVIGSHGAYKRTKAIYDYIKDELSGTPNPRLSTVS